ncbi:uncharacterized protein LOC131679467 [Topomyia yanbarensis]|uniref:uncharacterized protein LOC131679467 n=1 Tax=Topomyia yanbarensis TaxID=2498891 RepID=UPI00273CA588|nr:uncharacterized protein LOC131679467 [Topomyia yanbarensis]
MTEDICVACGQEEPPGKKKKKAGKQAKDAKGGITWICCDSCLKWFRTRCVRISPTLLADIVNYTYHLEQCAVIGNLIPIACNPYEDKLGGEKAEHGVGFIVIGKQMQRFIRWKPVSERICVLRVRGKFFNYSLINIYAPTNDKPDDVKDAFYECLDNTYGECPKHDVKTVIRDANAQVDREDFFRPIIARGMAISSTYFARNDIHKHTWMHPNGETCNQTDHFLVDGRHFSDVIDVRTCRGPNIDSDHYLVVSKIRARLSTVANSRTQ